MSKQKPIKEILTKNIISVSRKTSVLEAVSLMDKNKISCLIVVEDNKPVGIFTERDVVFVASKENHLESVAIEKLMSKPVMTVRGETNIYEAYNFILKHRRRHLVVVDPNGDLAGVVTQTDILNALELEYFVELRSISRIMTGEIETVKREDSVLEAVSKMVKHSLSCIIVKENESPVGILTERDVAHLLCEKIDMQALRIEEVMHHPVFTIPANTPVYEATKIMNKKKIRRLVVVDKRGKIAGLVTQSDIAQGLKEGYVEFLKDIIAQKDEALQETKRILSDKIVLDNILFSSPDVAIVATDLDLNIIYYNPVAETLSDYKKEEVINRPIMEILKEEGVELSRFEEALETVRREGKYKHLITRRKKDKVTYIDLAMSGMWDKSGNLVGFVAMAQDITKRKEMEEELLSLERIVAVGNISGSIAHEIRNPLSVIEGAIYLLKPKLREADKESYDYLDRIEIQISRITGIIKSLQSLTDIEETGKVRLDLAEAIEVALGRAEVPARIEVVKEVPKEKFIIMADKGQMAMVFTNLISNAIQSIMEEGTLSIKARRINEEEIELSFKDTGCGIAQENLRKVFWPLFSSKTRGMGFGLTLSQMIIEKHGGKIAVESEPGEGTTFVIKLPVFKER